MYFTGLSELGHYTQTRLADFGKKYIMIMYYVDTNSILTRPLKSRTAADITAAYNALHDYLSQRGYKLTMHKLDNEYPNMLK